MKFEVFTVLLLLLLLNINWYQCPNRNCCLLLQAMKEKGCTLIGECRHEMRVQHKPVSANGASTGQKYV